MPEDKMMHEASGNTCQQVAGRVVHKLQSMKNLFSGAIFDLGAKVDSENVWDEICVQIQTHPAANWQWYETLIINVIKAELKKLDLDVLAAIWRQTPAGIELAERRSQPEKEG